MIGIDDTALTALGAEVAQQRHREGRADCKRFKRQKPVIKAPQGESL